MRRALVPGPSHHSTHNNQPERPWTSLARRLSRYDRQVCVPEVCSERNRKHSRERLEHCAGLVCLQQARRAFLKRNKLAFIVLESMSEEGNTNGQWQGGLLRRLDCARDVFPRMNAMQARLLD